MIALKRLRFCPPEYCKARADASWIEISAVSTEVRVSRHQTFTRKHPGRNRVGLTPSLKTGEKSIFPGSKKEIASLNWT